MADSSTPTDRPEADEDAPFDFPPAAPTDRPTADLAALEAAATPAPWKVGRWTFPVDKNASGVGCGDESKAVATTVTEDDARLIAAARNALPGLLERAEEVEQLRELVRAMDKLLPIPRHLRDLYREVTADA